jgi:hypothetical protein
MQMTDCLITMLLLEYEPAAAAYSSEVVSSLVRMRVQQTNLKRERRKQIEIKDVHDQ